MLSFAVLTAACGDGGDDDGASPTNPPGGATVTAGGLIPDLAALGFTKTADERDPAAQPGQDVRRALYEKASPPRMAVRVDIAVLPTDALATTQFGSQSEALKNPPPDLFGGTSTPRDSTPIAGVGDQSRSFVTSKPDAQSNLVYTDLYRAGRVVFIVQVLMPSAENAAATRTAVAQAVLAKVK